MSTNDANPDPNLLRNQDSGRLIDIDTKGLIASGNQFDQNLWIGGSSYDAPQEFVRSFTDESSTFGGGDPVELWRGQLQDFIAGSPALSGLVGKGADLTAKVLSSTQYELEVLDEIRLGAGERGTEVLHEAQEFIVQKASQVRSDLNQRADMFAVEHPELVDRLETFKQETLLKAEELTSTVGQAIGSGLKAGFSALVRSAKDGYNRLAEAEMKLVHDWEERDQPRVLPPQGVTDQAMGQSVQFAVAPMSSTAEKTPLAVVADSQIAGFMGQVIADVAGTDRDAIVRSGPGRSFAQVDVRSYGDRIEFDAAVEGDLVDYSRGLGMASNKWYRIAGTTDQYVSAAIVNVSKEQVVQPSVESPKFISSSVQTEQIMGKVIAPVVNVRSGPGSGFEDVGDRYQGQLIEFDARIKGEFVDYSATLGTASDEWFRIKGTSEMISAALITTELSTEQSPEKALPVASNQSDKSISVDWNSPAYHEDKTLVVLSWNTGSTEYIDWIEHGKLPKNFPKSTPTDIPPSNHIKRHYFENLELNPKSGSNSYILGKPPTEAEQVKLYREAIYKATRGSKDIISSGPDNAGRLNFKVKLTDGNIWNINPADGAFYPTKGPNIFVINKDTKVLDNVVNGIKNGKSFLQAMRDEHVGYELSGGKKNLSAGLIRGLKELAKLKNFSQTDIVIASGQKLEPFEVTSNPDSKKALDNAVETKASGRSYKFLKWGGKLLFVVSLAYGGYEIYEARTYALTNLPQSGCQSEIGPT